MRQFREDTTALTASNMAGQRLVYALGVLVVFISATVKSQDHDEFMCQACTVGDIGPGLAADAVTGSYPMFQTAIFQARFVFTCEGSLSHWHFCSAAAGTLYLSVWTYESDRFFLKSWFKIDLSSTPGCQTYEIPLADRIHVGLGDRVGVSYDTPTGAALLRGDDSNTVGAVYQAVDMDTAVLFPAAGHDAGTEPVIEKDSGAEVAGNLFLEAQVLGICTYIRLEPDTQGVRMGRAEIFRSGQWGTICDRWFELHGWPSTFCRQLGYPTALEAKYTFFAGEPFHLPWASPIPVHIQSPNLCKPSLRRPIAICPVHSKGYCDHKRDVFIECKPKVRCLYDVNMDVGTCKRTKCVPQIWIGGCWGHICDSYILSSGIAWGNSWANAFCKEIGYARADEVFAAPNNNHLNVPILYRNPECEVTPPTIIDNCPPSGRPCNYDNLVQIICSKGGPECDGVVP